MNILVTILIVIAAIVVLLLIAALLTPKRYTVTVSETINQPKEKIFDYIRILKNQEQYSEWLKADPNLNPVITGTDGAVGAIQKWKSEDKNVGEGEQEIKAITEDSIEMELRFFKPIEGVCQVVNTVKSLGGSQSQVTFNFYSFAKFPFNLPSYVIGRKFITKTQQQNLMNVKAIMEA